MLRDKTVADISVTVMPALALPREPGQLRLCVPYSGGLLPRHALLPADRSRWGTVSRLGRQVMLARPQALDIGPASLGACPYHRLAGMASCRRFVHLCETCTRICGQSRCLCRRT